MQTIHLAIWLGAAVNDAPHQEDDVMLCAAPGFGKKCCGKAGRRRGGCWTLTQRETRLWCDLAGPNGVRADESGDVESSHFWLRMIKEPVPPFYLSGLKVVLFLYQTFFTTSFFKGAQPIPPFITRHKPSDLVKLLCFLTVSAAMTVWSPLWSDTGDVNFTRCSAIAIRLKNTDTIYVLSAVFLTDGRREVVFCSSSSRGRCHGSPLAGFQRRVATFFSAVWVCAPAAALSDVSAPKCWTRQRRETDPLVFYFFFFYYFFFTKKSPSLRRHLHRDFFSLFLFGGLRFLPWSHLHLADSHDEDCTASAAGSVSLQEG